MDDLTRWLKQNGLDGLAQVMRENDVDLELLPKLTVEDLKELGLTIGQRRRLLDALQTIDDQAPSTAEAPPKTRSEPDREPHHAEHADRRQITVLFCDLVDSTGLSRRLDPEEIRDLMRAYQDTAVEAVTRYDGHVAKFLGDGVLAYFGWPLAFEDQAVRAVHAGLEMISSVGAIVLEDGSPLAVRVGVASGEVVIGDIDHAAWTEAGAIAGETPNLAARLQAAAGPGELFIGEETRRLVGAAFEIESRGDKQLKGFDVAVRGYAVLGTRAVESRFHAICGGAITALVGRTEELGLLVERWERAKDGQGQAVLLSGEAGIGKSRLIEALVERAAEATSEIERLQCSPYFSNSAFHPVIERARSAAGIFEGDPAEAQTAKLRELFTRDGVKLEAALPVYERLLSIETPTATAAGPAPSEIKDQTLRVLAERTIGLARRGPLLIVLEDAHWIDPSTRELFELLISSIADMPIMIVLTHRPDWSTDWAELFRHVSALRLGQLDGGQIAELMREVLGEEPAEELVDDIARRTEGVPLFVEEFCHAIADQQATSGARDVTVPASLQASLMARLDRLPPAAKSLALVASVIGREFDRGLLGQAAGVSEDELDDGLAALRRLQVIFVSGRMAGAFVFRHALVQDTAYNSLLVRTRRHHHAAIADAFERHHPEIVAREPELVARHHVEARNAPAALPHWMRAAERALAGSAAVEALSHAQQAVEIAEAGGQDAVQARIYLGRALESSGDLHEAIETLREAVGLARDLGEPRLFIDATLAFANALFISMQPPAEALEPLEEALNLLPAGATPLESQILSDLLRGAIVSGDHVRLQVYRQRAFEAAKATGDSAALHGVQIAGFLGPAVMRTRDEIENWRAMIDEMLETADQLNDDFRARGRSIAFYISTEMGDRERMKDTLERVKQVGAARKHMHIASIARYGDALVAILSGRFDEAERCSKEALEIGRRTFGPNVEGVYGTQMFTIRREQGRLAEVAPVVKRMIKEDPDASAWKPGFAVIAVELGFDDAARRLLDEIAEGGFVLEYDAKYSTTLSYLADVATAIGDEARCEALYELLLPYEKLTIAAGVTTLCLGSGARYLGRLATTLGDWDTAETHFRTAIEVDEQIRAVPWLAHTRYALADMLARRGRSVDTTEITSLRQQVLEATAEFDMVALKDKCTRYFQ